jgi:hypothetical protein
LSRRLAAGFGVGTATAWRYVIETVALLAARSPKLRPALRDAAKAGDAYLVIDGTLIPIDRVAADRPFYSGKHRNHGMNLQVLASRTATLREYPGPVPCCPGPVATEFLHGTASTPARLPVTPMDPGDVVAASLTALDLGETACIPGLGDPAAIEDYHAAARQLVQARGPALASRYLTTAVPHTQAEPPARRPTGHSRPGKSPAPAR